MKFLVFQHVANETPGFLKTIADKQGIALEIVEFWKPSAIPNVADFDGLIIMGGPMGVYEGADKFPSKNAELAAIKSALGKIPIIGFCLGSQLLASALGAKVYPNERDGKKVKEIGYYEVQLTTEGQSDPLFRGFSSPVKVLQWHGDAFDLPQNAVRLAASPDCQNQAFRFGRNAYGFLFHFEFTPEMVETQVETDRDWIHDGFELDEALLKKQSRENAAIMEKQCRKLFTNFIKLA